MSKPTKEQLKKQVEKLTAQLERYSDSETDFEHATSSSSDSSSSSDGDHPILCNGGSWCFCSKCFNPNKINTPKFCKQCNTLTHDLNQDMLCTECISTNNSRLCMNCHCYIENNLFYSVKSFICLGCFKRDLLEKDNIEQFNFINKFLKTRILAKHRNIYSDKIIQLQDLLTSTLSINSKYYHEKLESITRDLEFMKITNQENNNMFVNEIIKAENELETYIKKINAVEQKIDKTHEQLKKLENPNVDDPWDLIVYNKFVECFNSSKYQPREIIAKFPFSCDTETPGLEIIYLTMINSLNVVSYNWLKHETILHHIPDYNISIFDIQPSVDPYYTFINKYYSYSENKQDVISYKEIYENFVNYATNKKKITIPAINKFNKHIDDILTNMNITKHRSSFGMIYRNIKLVK